MSKTIKKETIHAAGIDIGIYTTDFKNEFISLTDIAKYKSMILNLSNSISLKKMQDQMLMFFLSRTGLRY